MTAEPTALAIALKLAERAINPPLRVRFSLTVEAEHTFRDYDNLRTWLLEWRAQGFDARVQEVVEL